jgi:hypothetical protein
VLVGAITTNTVEAEVIGEDEDDVRLAGSGERSGARPSPSPTQIVLFWN